MTSRLASVPLLALSLSIGIGCAAGGEEGDPDAAGADCSESGACDIASPEALCTWKVKGRGNIDIENDYLPHVIACENGNADLEALKAQAIAARSYIHYVARVEKRPISDGQGDQVFTCGRTPNADHIAAVKATSGKILTYKGSYVAAFFVAGALQKPPQCRGGTNDPTRTEKYVTYNLGRSGTTILQSGLGFKSPRNRANRGCMSQNGSHCLSQNGKTMDEILRFYYGEDIEVTQMNGQCVEGGGGGNGQIGTACTMNESCAFSVDTNPAECLSWFNEDTSALAGFCTIDCAGTCPAGSTCGEPSPSVNFGQCLPNASGGCSRYADTEPTVINRWIGAGKSTELATVCAPPQTPPVTCNSGGFTGECIDTGARQCGGTIMPGLCPGGANIRCCLE